MGSIAGTCLVTGGALGDIPIIIELKRMGFRVVTSGNRPEDLGHRFSDEYTAADYTNVKEISDICRKRKFDAIISSCHDLAYIAASKVAEEFGFAGFDSPQNAEILHSKNLLRKMLAELSIPTPKFAECTSLNQGISSILEMQFPIIVKPVDLTGGNGVSICQDNSYFERAFIHAFSKSRAKKVIVEELLSGSYHGLSTLIQGGKLVSFFLDDEFYLPKNFRVSATAYPSSVDISQIEPLLLDAQKLVSALKLTDGLLHFQLILTARGPIIIEVMRRTPGDFYSDFVNMSSNINYARNIIIPYLGERLEDNEMISKGFAQEVDYSTMRFMLMAKSRGIIESFNFKVEHDPSKKIITRPIGSFIENPRIETCGILFFQRPNARASNNSWYQEIHDNFQINVVTNTFQQ